MRLRIGASLSIAPNALVYAATVSDSQAAAIASAIQYLALAGVYPGMVLGKIFGIQATLVLSVSNN